MALGNLKGTPASFALLFSGFTVLDAADSIAFGNFKEISTSPALLSGFCVASVFSDCADGGGATGTS